MKIIHTQEAESKHAASRHATRSFVISSSPPSLVRHLRECWNYKFVAAMLSWRSIKLRYATTLAGPIWILIQPVIQVALITMVFGSLIRIDTGCDYLLFAIISMSAWTFVNASIDRMGNSLMLYRDFITKVRIPALLYPASAVSVTLADLLLTLLVANGIAIYKTQSAPEMIPLVIALAGIIALTTALGIGIAVAALFIRDIKLVIPLIAQVLMYCSPVLYPVALIPDRVRDWYCLNPLAAYFELLRSAYGIPAMVSAPQLLFAGSTTLVLFVASAWVFNRNSHRFPELI